MLPTVPGEKIFPGELAKALDILAGGGEVDYVGATAVEFLENGDSAGSFREVMMEGGKFEDRRLPITRYLGALPDGALAVRSALDVTARAARERSRAVCPGRIIADAKKHEGLPDDDPG